MEKGAGGARSRSVDGVAPGNLGLRLARSLFWASYRPRGEGCARPGAPRAQSEVL